VRRFEVDGRTLLLSDTVGFIRKLPHGLVESFKSTLDEIRESDLLLHVVDVSSAHASDHIRVVRETLRDIGAEETPEILVFNKVDRIDSADRLTAIRNDHPGCRFVSAMRGIGLDDLKGAITERLSPDETTLTLLVDAAQGRSLSRIHEWGRVERTDVLEDQIRLQVKLPNQYLDRVNTLPGVRPA
jgi:GTPase